MKKVNFKIILFYLVLIAVVFGVVYFLIGKEAPEEIRYGQVVEYFENDQVEKFTVDKNYTLKLWVYSSLNEDGTVAEGTKTNIITYDIPAYIDFVGQFSKYYQGNDVNKNLNVSECNIEPEKTTSIWLMFLPSIIIIVVLVIFCLFYVFGIFFY